MYQIKDCFREEEKIPHTPGARFTKISKDDSLDRTYDMPNL